MPLSREEIEAELRRLAPFHHDVSLPYGLSTQSDSMNRRPGERTRVREVMSHAWPKMLELCGGSLQGKRVLDVGCNCGGFALRAAEGGAAYVLGVDVADRYIEQANFLKQALGFDQVEFRRLRIEDLDSDETGRFDVTLCLGLLYHLENPVHGMRRLSDLTTQLMLVDTMVDPRVTGAYWRMNLAGAADPDSRDASTSLWREERMCQFLPTAEAVKKLMRFLGFERVARLRPHANMGKRYLSGRRVTFIATRQPAAASPPAGRAKSMVKSS